MARRPSRRALLEKFPPAPKRPRAGPRSSSSLLIWFTSEERETLDAAAKRAGLGLGPWLRSLGLREAGR